VGPMATMDVLRGAIDLHVHGYPEARADADHVVDDVEAAALARDLGIRGYVLKSHFWPTMGRAYHISRAVENVEAVPSITLNSLVGGISPTVVEMAVLQGARALWFPTWSASNDLERGGLSARVEAIFPGARRLVPNGGLSVLSDGKLTPAAREVLAIAAREGLLVGTGHLSTTEGLALAKEADRIGFRQLVFTHPQSNSVGAALEEIRVAADLGAWIELRFVSMLPARQSTTLRDVLEVVELVGADRCVLTTDGGFDSWSSPAPSLLRLYVANLLAIGTDPKTVRTMVVDNPARALHGDGVPAYSLEPVTKG
jgi:hypothetical protein